MSVSRGLSLDDIEELSDSAPLGPQEVATFLAVKRPTVQQWLFRGVLPDPDFIVSGFPAWKKRTIVRWAVQTHRLDSDDIRAA